MNRRGRRDAGRGPVDPPSHAADRPGLGDLRPLHLGATQTGPNAIQVSLELRVLILRHFAERHPELVPQEPRDDARAEGRAKAGTP